MDKPPTGLEIDISLSFNTIITLWPDWANSFNPSNANPFCKDESPMKAMISYFSPFKSLANANPAAAEIEVDE